MARTVTSTNNLSLRSILEKDKLTGSNFLDCERNLMIVLRHERKWYVLEEPLGEAPPATAPATARNAHKKHSDDLLDVACLMLATMSPDLQAGLINTNAYDMIRQLRDMFQTQARTERYHVTKAFNECKMVKGTSVSDHVMKMKRHLDHLERLGHPVPLQLATDTILNSLSEDYRPFVVNYNMNNMEKSIAELHSILKTAELNMGNKNKTKDVLMVRDGGVKKKNGHTSTSKGKGPVQAVQSAPRKAKARARARRSSQTKLGPRTAASHAMRSVTGGRIAQSVMKQNSSEFTRRVKWNLISGGYDQLQNNSYKCCRLKLHRKKEKNEIITKGKLNLVQTKSHSKALVTELPNSDSETIEDDSSESDVDLKRKKFYSKPKFENYKRDKYKPKEYEKRPERKSYEKGNTDEKGNVCFNCGKPGHFVKDCKAPKVRDFDYYSKKAQLAKRKNEGKVLMAEEEYWYDDTSDDENSAHFTQVHYNLMASVEETINLHKEIEASIEEKIKFERARVIEFSNECALYKWLADDRELKRLRLGRRKPN
ncbi:hypothetical protein OSB04_001500 [Centaurea solstitialis]|uniref:CCHC-type domain-containing protein n=1 Tax=Centaurea solstitialis TaxID=347529 RepID=A0AA38WUG9_9ASTR|nr:hypothetical protein OSB04_001500 [Centaurea solstitialis]